MKRPTILLSLVLSVAVASSLACGPRKTETTNADMLGSYDEAEYGEDIVTADGYEKHDDQGAAISPRTLAHIDDTIRSVYTTDFARCLEREMERLDTKWLAGTFTVEFRIDIKGNVHDIKMLAVDINEKKTAEGKTPRSADKFGDCLEELLVEWNFDPPPEAEFVHTYNGEMEEAW